jgi:hypothetical protein
VGGSQLKWFLGVAIIAVLFGVIAGPRIERSMQDDVPPQGGAQGASTP